MLTKRLVGRLFRSAPVLHKLRAKFSARYNPSELLLVVSSGYEAPRESFIRLISECGQVTVVFFHLFYMPRPRGAGRKL